MYICTFAKYIQRTKSSTYTHIKYTYTSSTYAHIKYKYIRTDSAFADRISHLLIIPLQCQLYSNAVVNFAAS